MSELSHKNRLLLFAFLAVIGLTGILVYIAWQRNAPRRLADRAQAALDRNNYPVALESAVQLLRREPESTDGMRAAALAARGLRQYELAIHYYEGLTERGALKAADQLALGELLLHQNRPSDAEQCFRGVLAKDPENVTVRLDLIDLLSIECRVLEAAAERHYLLENNIWSTEALLFLAKPEDLYLGSELDAFLENNPDEPHLLVAKARLAKLINKHDESSRWIERALTARPDFVDAHAERGLLLLETELTDDAFGRWHHEVPNAGDQHPDIWIVRGFWCKSHDHANGSVRCFAEALRLAPNHRLATHQLSLALASVGEESLASKLADRVDLLDLLSRVVDSLYDTPNAPEYWLEGAGLLEQLGRVREAIAWYRTFLGFAPNDKFAIKKVAELDQGRTSTIAPHPLLALNPEQYELPAFVTKPASSAAAVESKPGKIEFVDVAEQMGLRHALIGSDGPLIRPRRMCELFGSGIAVVDFDGDGWADVYCAQGTAGGEDPDHIDRLFQNLGGAGFVDVTHSARLGDARFSQGAAIGDFDNDGFPDLFLGNVGENRLYRNNGDGTYAEVTNQARIAGSRWTTSCLIADLNGDTLPDLYEVNYLGGSDLFSVWCGGFGPGGGRNCSPTDFPAEADRFFLNLGNGQFVDRTEEAGFTAPEGKGLGVVAADFDQDGRLSLFIANDTTANHFYVNQAPRGDEPAFEERAVLLGLAFDRNGLSQACMGIAVDDADADGHLDLFVTNFYNEPNTLYLGDEELRFDDGTRAARLHAAGLPALGFGTQFLDADLDADHDLVVANGHIHDSGNDGSSFQMFPQIFENQGGRFIEHLSAGAYFSRRVVGRALARLDFDRDGLDDFTVSHLDAPLALLHNQSESKGHFLAVRLRGVLGDRDAVGALVTVVADDGRRHIRQVTAGDGYLCSNQRQLVFGTGAAKTVSKLRIRWPSGTVQEFSNVATDQEILIVEGREWLYTLPR